MQMTLTQYRSMDDYSLLDEASLALARSFAAEPSAISHVNRNLLAVILERFEHLIARSDTDEYE